MEACAQNLQADQFVVRILGHAAVTSQLRIPSLTPSQSLSVRLRSRGWSEGLGVARHLASLVATPANLAPTVRNEGR